MFFEVEVDMYGDYAKFKVVEENTTLALESLRRPEQRELLVNLLQAAVELTCCDFAFDDNAKDLIKTLLERCERC